MKRIDPIGYDIFANFKSFGHTLRKFLHCSCFSKFGTCFHSAKYIIEIKRCFIKRLASYLLNKPIRSNQEDMDTKNGKVTHPVYVLTEIA